MVEQFSILEISRRVRTGQDSIYELSAHLPCHFHINSIHDFSLLEISPVLQELLQMSAAELQVTGPELLEQIVHPSDLKNAIRLNQSYLAEIDSRSHISFFQRLTFPKKPEPHFFFTRGKLLDQNRILNMSLPLHHSSLFNHKVLELYENAQFIRDHIHKFNRLTEREITVCKTLCNGENLSEVALLLGVSKHTAKNHRTNIYRKLEVKNFFEFYYFASRFKLNI